MERTERRLVQCLLFTVLVLFAIYPTKGSEVDTPKITHHSVRSPSPSVFCPVRSPVAGGVKQPSNITHVPLASHHSLGFTPMVSPEPHAALKKLNITFAPLPVSSSVISPAHEVREPSNTRPLSFASRPPMSISAPVISPTPHKIENSTHSSLPSHPFPLQSSPLISPSPYEAKPSNFTYSPHSSHLLPSESSPEMSPAPHEVKDPSGIKQSPLPSVSKPPGLPPVISPTSQEEVKEPKNILHSPFSSASPVIISPPPHGLTNPSILAPSPLASMPKPSASSPVISPAPRELKDPANITSELPPMLSPAPHEFINPSPISPAPLASKPKLSESSSLISPAPQELKDPPNIRSAPLSSHPNHSGLAPAVRPAQHDLKGSSNIVHAPLPSQASPAVSPAPHKLNNSSTVINSPLASHEITSGASPVLSPVRQEVNDPINVTHSPLPSHSLPLELAPEISPAPHKVSPAHNVAHSPLPTGVSPARSPTPNEVKQPSNVTRSPWPTHQFPSGSTPAMSPAPHELKDTSNISHSPLPSHPHSSEISHSISPSSHGVSNPVNMTNAPSVSHPQSPLSPVRHEAKNSTGTKHSPLASHVHSERTILAPAPAPIVSNSKPSATIRSGNSAPSSLIPGNVLSPGQSDTSPVSPENEHRSHAPSPFIGGPISSNQPSSYPPVVAPESNQRHHPPSPYLQGPSRSPTLPPSGSLRKGTQAPMPVWILPPPPPNLDCKSLMCLGSYTYPATGSFCACVLPVKVGLRLSIAVYTFFPLVSELAREIASGVAVNQSQVRIMGANVATEDPEKTIVLIDLVPFGGSFNTSTALVIFRKFWQKQVPIKFLDFGDYEVLYVSYPGLPPSPPVASDVNVDGTLGNGGNGAIIKPLGVDVGKKKGKVRGTSIAIVVLSSVIVVVIIVGVAWALLWKCRKHSHQPPSTSQQALPSLAKLSAAGAGPGALGSGPSSTTASFSSSIPAYTGSAKTFSLSEMERATHRFSESRIIGEGGFGRVYRGTLEDGTMVAVKVLKRDDQQGGREFLAEVEMLSRLHHRNLVKLIGICTEENVRCLIYELIPNGSVESHLHGSDKETSQLDWSARLKIALGAARGLAYLHEDSSPRVIHRDFKSSNILLEHDFTPKVSDFGLARAALEEQNDHISTRVMGTFGYVAPEYAMTGHLLVKSDVYSYGVVLLELLTGRKPVDMSQPPGQETLVSWARPHLTSVDGLSTLIDPALGPDVSLDSVAKVAAIASMCVQPEVSHRPFMGEVVQALKLVYNESDGHRRSFSQDDSSAKDSEMRISPVSGPESHIFCASSMFANNVSGSFRRYSNSGPLRDGGGQKFWQKVRGFSSGSMAGVGFHRDPRLGPDVEHGGQWP